MGLRCDSASTKLYNCGLNICTSNKEFYAHHTDNIDLFFSDKMCAQALFKLTLLISFYRYSIAQNICVCIMGRYVPSIMTRRTRSNDYCGSAKLIIRSLSDENARKRAIQKTQKAESHSPGMITFNHMLLRV